VPEGIEFLASHEVRNSRDGFIARIYIDIQNTTLPSRVDRGGWLKKPLHEDVDPGGF
jgi:hypothetical protein